MKGNWVLYCFPTSIFMCSLEFFNRGLSTISPYGDLWSSVVHYNLLQEPVTPFDRGQKYTHTYTVDAIASVFWLEYTLLSKIYIISNIHTHTGIYTNTHTDTERVRACVCACACVCAYVCVCMCVCVCGQASSGPCFEAGLFQTPSSYSSDILLFRTDNWGQRHKIPVSFFSHFSPSSLFPLFLLSWFSCMSLLSVSPVSLSCLLRVRPCACSPAVGLPVSEHAVWCGRLIVLHAAWMWRSVLI